MTDVEIIRTLDAIEAELRGLEHRCFAIRAALRKRVDPRCQRKDLGYWHDDAAPPAAEERQP